MNNDIKELLRELAEYRVADIRGSSDVPGFEACVDAELKEIMAALQAHPVPQFVSSKTPNTVHKDICIQQTGDKQDAGRGIKPGMAFRYNGEMHKEKLGGCVHYYVGNDPTLNADCMIFVSQPHEGHTFLNWLGYRHNYERWPEKDKITRPPSTPEKGDKWLPIEHCPKTPDKFYDLYTKDGCILFQCNWEYDAWTHDIFDGNPPYSDHAFTHYRETDMATPPQDSTEGEKE